MAVFPPRESWHGTAMEPGGQGQLPSGQTAKVRPDYRVQSLRKGHGRHALHQKHCSDTQNEFLSGYGQS
jgi:hypothetical protein